MNIQQYLMLVAMEECGEVVSDYLNKKEYVFELVDLLAAIELVESNSTLCAIEQPFEVPSEDKLMKDILELQKLFSKSIRFGLDSIYAGLSNKELIEVITPSIRAYINRSFLNKEDMLKSMVAIKKEKINKFLHHSLSSGLVVL